MMPNTILRSLLVLVAAAPAVAHADETLVARGDQTSNQLTLQVGLLPSLTFAGAEYTRKLHDHVELAGSLSAGAFAAGVSGWYAFQSAVVPRLRWSRGAWKFGAGVGVSVAYAYSNNGDDVKRGLVPRLVGEGVVSYVTRRGLVLQGVAGVTACRGADSSLCDESERVLPVVALGLGWSF